jgi:predicted DNA binding CopG/RHH family protein
MDHPDVAKGRPADLTSVTLNLYRDDVLKIRARAASTRTSYQVWIREKVHEAVAREKSGGGKAAVVR